jgi:hypothetical protein
MVGQANYTGSVIRKIFIKKIIYKDPSFMFHLEMKEHFLFVLVLF